MRKIFSIVCLAFSLGAWAQNSGSIEGKILDQDGLPMIAVNVEVSMGEKLVYGSTDLDGKFRIKPLAAGNYNLRATFIGYLPIELNGIQVSTGITRLEKMTMNYDTAELGIAEVFDYKVPLIKQDEPSVIEVKSVIIEKMPVKNDIVGLITALAPAASTDPNTGELYFRGSRAGTTQYFIDGIKYTGVSPKVPTAALSGVSIYSGGIPAKFGDVTGGVVWLETKSYFELYNQRKNELAAMGFGVE